MSLGDLQAALLCELHADAIAGADFDEQYQDSEEWFIAAESAINNMTVARGINPESLFNDLEESTLDPDSDTCVYAYFVFINEDD